MTDSLTVLMFIMLIPAAIAGCGAGVMCLIYMVKVLREELQNLRSKS